MDKAMTRLYNMGNLIVRVVGSAIFLVLVWYAYRYTQYMMPGDPEIPVNVYDSQKQNLLCLAMAVAAMAALMVFEKKTDVKIQILIRRISAAAMLGWIVTASLWWIHSSAHVPVGDQAFVYGGASYFMEGGYEFLGVSGYCGMYPHQLGLMALMEGFFRIVGAYNYYAYELLCMLLAAGSAYCGYRILQEMTGSTAVVVGYNILMLGCLPLIFYTPWVYGDIPGIFFALLAEWMLLRYEREKKTYYLVIMGISLVLAMMVRKHSLVLFIAMGIAILLHSLFHKDKKSILAFLLTVVLTWGVFGGIYKMYEIRSGYEHSKGIPSITWIAMGMQETNGAYGWYNNYPKDLYYNLECDSEKTAAAAREELQERLNEFRNDPAYAWTFFREKILSQWNEPLYQALFFTTESAEGVPGPEEGSLADRVSGEDYMKVLRVCDRWQIVIYAGMLCYFLFGVKKGSNILQHIPAIAMIGGFFFSALVEAKARYIFPYYIMMFPYAAFGWRMALRNVELLVNRRKKNSKVVDIEDKRKVA